MPRSSCRVVGIDHISVRVSDYDKSKKFYAGLFAFLGFDVSDDYGTTIGWTNGKTRFWIAAAEGRKTYQIGDVGLHHYAFELRNRKDVDALQVWLEGSGCTHRRSCRRVLRRLLCRVLSRPRRSKLEGMKYGELTAHAARVQRRRKS